MGMEIWNNHKKLNGAIQSLNDKAKSKSEEFGKTLEHKFYDVKDALEEAALLSKRALQRAKRIAEEAVEEGELKFKQTARQVNKSVRKNPWPFIGGVAAGALAVGFALGLFSKRK